MAKRQGSSCLRHGPGAGLYAAFLALGLIVSPVRAQSGVSVLPLQGLRFGTLASGMPTLISPLDAAGHAAIQLVGSGAVSISFELPAGLRTARGDRILPLRFGAGDGRVLFGHSSRSIVFDPAQPVSFQLAPGQGGATVYLGGAAEPGPAQAPGTYSGSITVNVVVANSAT
jgi:hypothetical protein